MKITYHINRFYPLLPTRSNRYHSFLSLLWWLFFVNGSMLLGGMGYNTPSFRFYICLSLQ